MTNPGDVGVLLGMDHAGPGTLLIGVFAKGVGWGGAQD